MPAISAQNISVMLGRIYENVALFFALYNANLLLLYGKTM